MKRFLLLLVLSVSCSTENEETNPVEENFVLPTPVNLTFSQVSDSEVKLS